MNDGSDSGAELGRGTAAQDGAQAAGAPPPPLLLRVERLVKTFTHGRTRLDVLRGIDMTVAPGEMVSIVGASGAGKSTFLHIVGTIDRPTSGSVFFEGRDLARMRPGELARFRNRSIGFVFQFHHLLDEFTALENTIMPGLIAGGSPRQLAERGRALLEQVGLADRMTHRPAELSGGEQQRVAIARGLMMEPKVLLADEPTGNLDSRTSEGLCELLFRLNEARRTTLILVTHNGALAAMMPRRLEMKDGIIVDAP